MVSNGGGSNEIDEISENFEKINKIDNPKAKNPLGIVKFDGFDDIDCEIEEFDEDSQASSREQNSEKKRKRGGKKKNKRRNLELIELYNADKNENYQDDEHMRMRMKAQRPLHHSLIKSSRLLQELQHQEQVSGMTRDETRQLIEDKLLFLGDNVLKSIRLRRYCLVITSPETFDLGNGTKIPSEIVSISMDNGKINSILRFFPTYTKTFEMEAVEVYEKHHRMKRVNWNPSILRDSNLMCRTWCHFLGHCFLNLILVPLSSQKPLLDFLRTMNEIRTVLNGRSTVSICLSRVVSVEDFLRAAQNIISPITPHALPERPENCSSVDYGLQVCRYHLQSMSKIFMSATMKPAAISRNDDGSNRALPLYNNNNGGMPPPTVNALQLRHGSNNYFGGMNTNNYSFLEYIDDAPGNYSIGSEKYQRIMRWISSLEAFDETTSSEEWGQFAEEMDVENAENMSEISTRSL